MRLQHSMGVPGLLGLILLLVWAIGWIVFGLHEFPWHLLVPVGIALSLAQVVRRVAG